MGFDYGYTCGTIDQEIDNAKSVISNNLEELINEITEWDNESAGKVNDYTKWIYNELQQCFEIARGSNQDMRVEAENQIDRLEDEVSELDHKVYEYEQEISELQNNQPKLEEF